MEQNSLTHIEREIVLKYLADGRVPVTVTPMTNGRGVCQEVFSVATGKDAPKLFEAGLILLIRRPDATGNFSTGNVKVEFCFNKIGLRFFTYIKNFGKMFAIDIPDSISRIEYTREWDKGGFHAIIFCDGKAVPCFADNDFIFSKPNTEIMTSLSKKYFRLLFREQSNISHTICLIPVSQYLAEHSASGKSIADRREPLAVLYVCHECIVLGCESRKTPVRKGGRYSIEMFFPVPCQGGTRKREVFATCCVERVCAIGGVPFSCAICTLSALKEEDKRFIYEMSTGALFK